MKIALLGAPGTGKSAIAKRAVKILNTLPLGDLIGDQTNPPGKQWKVIDGYVERLAKRTGLFQEELATIPQNLAVITERWVLEAEAQNKHINTITCGSLYETIIYSSFTTLFTPMGEGSLVYDQLFNQVMMHALGALEGSTYDYDAIFWVPWTQEHFESDQDSWNAVLNAKLPEALDGFNKVAIPLLGTDKERADRVVEVLRIIAASTSPSDDEPAVRPSTDAGEGT
jgi:hypothetical protein